MSSAYGIMKDRKAALNLTTMKGELPMEMHENAQKLQKALLVGIDTGEYDAEGSMEELRELVKSSGAEPAAIMMQKRDKPDGATCVGSGRIEEIREFCEQNDIDFIVFDTELSPTQIRNIEDATNVRTIDRTMLILDIFALRARTNEGKLQVELAQLKYLMPRLTGKGREMSRLGGGVGTRGPGETKLETDKRHIRRRIEYLKNALSEMTERRDRRREKRRKDGVKSRPFSGVVKLYVPKESWIKKLLEYEAIKIVTDENGNEKWKAIHSGKVLNKSDIEILSDYNAKVRGLFNYYCIADNAYVIGKFGRAMKYSMMKTFAFKYKTKVSKIKKKYVKNGDFTVSYETKQGIKTSVFYNQGYGKRDKSIAGQVKLLPQYKRYDKPNSLARKLKTKTCELCGCYCTDLEIHQVKKLKNLKGNSEWEKLMLKRRRKTLAVCPACHKQIHSCDEER